MKGIRENGIPRIKTKKDKTAEETPVEIIAEDKTPIEETEVEGEGEFEASKTKEATTLSIKELDTILEEAEEFTTTALMTGEEIDQLIEKRKRSLNDIAVQIANTSENSRRMRTIENNSPKNFKPNDYERLIKRRMIEEKYAERLIKLDSNIAKLESLKYPSVEAQARLEKFSEIRDGEQEKIKSQITDRYERAKNNLLEYNEERIKYLEERIKEIESNPRVMERLQVMKKEEHRIFEVELEKKRKEIIKEIIRYTQSLDSRHESAFKRIAEIIGDEKIRETLEKTLKEGDSKKQQSAFDSVRDHLKNSIISGEDKMQLKNPGEIVPWRGGYTPIRYKDAIDFLNSYTTKEILRGMIKEGNEQAQKLLKRLKETTITNRTILKLVGPQWVTNHKTNEKRMTTFWAAFETRKINDEKGITEANKKEREKIAEQKEISRKAIEEVVKLGGFVVSVPIFKKVRDKRVEDGREKGAVLLEKLMSKKNNEYWSVKKVAGTTNGLKVGSVSPLDMSSFPIWLRESYQLHLE